MKIKLSKIEFATMGDLINYAIKNRVYMKKDDKMYIDAFISSTCAGVHFICLDNSPNEFMDVIRFLNEEQTFYKLV